MGFHRRGEPFQVDLQVLMKPIRFEQLLRACEGVVSEIAYEMFIRFLHIIIVMVSYEMNL